MIPTTIRRMTTIENDDRKEEDDKDRKSNNGESELIAIPTRTLFNSSYNVSAGKISEY